MLVVKRELLFFILDFDRLSFLSKQIFVKTNEFLPNFKEPVFRIMRSFEMQDLKYYSIEI